MAQTGVHPGYTLSSLRPAGFEPRISGMDFLPDGRMVICTWDNFSKSMSPVYLLSNVETGDRSKVTFKEIAGNLRETLEEAGPGAFTGKTSLPAGMYSVSVAGGEFCKTRQVTVLAR